MKSVSFNISFRAWRPSRSGLILEFFESHSLAHSIVEKGLFSPDLPASTEIDSKARFQHKSVTGSFDSRRAGSIGTYPNLDFHVPSSSCHVNLIGMNSKSHQKGCNFS